MCVRDTRKGGRESEPAEQEEETEDFTILFSILVTKVTPGLHINMAKEPLCLSSLPSWAPGLSSHGPDMLGEAQTERPYKRGAVPPTSTHVCCSCSG